MPTLRNERNVTVTAGDTPMAPAQPGRKALIISAPKTSTVWVTFTGAAAVGKGMPLRPGQVPWSIGRDEYGEAIDDEIRGISEGVAEPICILQFFG